MKRPAPRAENLLQLMEWLRLGFRFHIHKEFLTLLKMTDIISLCLVSKHYNNKYLKYCYNYFMVSCLHILPMIKHNLNPNPNPNPKYWIIPSLYFANNRVYYEEYKELKKLYGTNHKFTKLINKYFVNCRRLVD